MVQSVRSVSRWSSWVVLLSFIVSGCASLKPGDIPVDEKYVVVVRERQVQRPWIFWAKHCWIGFKDGDDNSWSEFHVRRRGVVRYGTDARSASTDQREDRSPWWNPKHTVRAIYTGERARLMIAQLREQAKLYDNPSNEYRMWPGPNSNTFVQTMCREIDGFSVELSHNAIGKDFSWFRLGYTNTRTGLELQTPVLGARVGILEGVEVQILQLPFGVSVFPPALKLPSLPRIGFPPFHAIK